jgi:subtilisin family serine protease
MRSLRRIAQAACVIALCVPAATAARSNDDAASAPIRQPDVAGGYASTHVIIRARAGFVPGLAVQKKPNQPRDQFARTLARFQVTAIKPVFENGFADPELARRIGLDRYYRLETPPGTDTPGLADELSRLPAEVERAALDGIGGVAGTIPDDPDFGLQWGLLNEGQTVGGVAGVVGADINVSPAWGIATGDPDLVLAVLDAGMDAHVEIADRLIPGRNVAAEPDNNDTNDVCISHGTHVAGIAAATGNNIQGIAGVDWSCKIMPVRVLNSCSGPESYVAEGIVWATDNGADVINMSLQYYTGTSVLHDAVLYAYAQGKVMIAASGNSGACTVYNMAFPARWPETIAVGATNNVDERASFSNCGPELDVVAPGKRVWSLNNGIGYKYLDGTSMATPHVSGTVNLMKTLDPGLTPDEIKGVLQATTVDIGDPGFDNETGYGRINTHAALLEVQAGLADLDGSGVVDITDFLWLLGYWGPCPSEPGCLGDIDRDGTVGVGDFLIMLAVWG